jgi:hypothetical protein
VTAGVVLALVWAVASRCGDEGEAEGEAEGQGDDVLARITIPDPSDHWAREGFVEMVPAIRLPSSSAEAEDVAIWLRLPADAVIETQWSEARGGWVLTFPPGTVADRVEQRGRGAKRGVVDVRGTMITEDGQQLHTLRRAGSEADAPLFGYAWPRSDPEAHARATARLLAVLGSLPPATRMRDEVRTRYLDGIARKNECTHCHSYARPDNAREQQHGLVNRGTDGSGFFTPQTVLADAIVLERYGGHDPNLDDPAVTITCPDGRPATRRSKAKRVRAACLGGGVPIAQLDLQALEGPRLERICRARRYLFDHLDAQGKQVFGDALLPCREKMRDRG